MQGVFIGRQPIYDRNQNVFAYELLFRNSKKNFADIENPDQATSQLIVNALTEFGLSNIIGDKLGFINLTRNFINGSFPIPAEQNRLVLEMLEDIELDDSILQGIQRLKKDNYTIALDDFIFHPHLAPLVEIADIIKIDLMALNEQELKQHVEDLSKYPVKLLAEKVETHEEYQKCLDYGFEYFQGYFFCKPDVIAGKKTPANRLALLNLLSKISDPEADVEQIETLIMQDVTLSFRLLRYINSSHYAMDNEISSIKHAIMLLGIETVRSITYLIVVSSIEDKPFELFVTALIRAHMCELIASEVEQGDQAATYFMVGLFSVMDAIMDQPLDQVLAQLPLTMAISNALLKYEGQMGQALLASISYERGKWDELDFSIVDADKISAVYLQALTWCKNFLDTLDSLRAA